MSDHTTSTENPDGDRPKKRSKLQHAPAKMGFEPPLLEDFENEYGIPMTQFVWGPRQQSPSEDSFDEDETAPPPSVPNPYQKYPNSGGSTRAFVNHAPDFPFLPRSGAAPTTRLRPRPERSGRNKAKASNKLSLLDCPAEIREEIYRGLLASHKPIPVRDGWKRVYERERPGLDINILMVCKSIFNEAIGVLYGENTFLYRLRDAPNRSHVMTNLQDLVQGNAYVPERGHEEAETIMFGSDEIRAEAIHEPGTINVEKYASLFRYITLQADHNRAQSYTQEFMAEAIKMFAQEPGKTNIHTLSIVISPQYIHGAFTFVDWFDSKSELVRALRAVCCENIRIKIWNKYLNDGIGIPSSELFLRVHQLRFFKQLEYQKLKNAGLEGGAVQGEHKEYKPDIWKGDWKMANFRFNRLCEINKKLDNLRSHVLKACKKHLQPHVVRLGDLNDTYEDEDEEDWYAIFPDEATGSGSEEDMDDGLHDEFEAPSDDGNSDYED
ncbi:hypothetical protein FLONG3_10289 [Fusarium longipes]|uniref:Uncharacterized protein n=1 Tax=Fusarium longipes TaxID=694270 RepID=A0A395RQ03_9HYPO|nr:hypothetical protein FLONG3_10289 [Fusarium longipes]